MHLQMVLPASQGPNPTYAGYSRLSETQLALRCSSLSSKHLHSIALKKGRNSRSRSAYLGFPVDPHSYGHISSFSLSLRHLSHPAFCSGGHHVSTVGISQHCSALRNMARSSQSRGTRNWMGMIPKEALCCWWHLLCHATLGELHTSK